MKLSNLREYISAILLEFIGDLGNLHTEKLGLQYNNCIYRASRNKFGE